jgi:hypothetical protein
MAKLFAKFGEFDSAEEINRAAAAQKAQGDNEAVRTIAKENGIDEMYVDDFLAGDYDELCNPLIAAIGKLDIETADLDLPTSLQLWVDFIKNMMLEENDKQLMIGIRRKGKDLVNLLAKLIVETSKSRKNVPGPIVSAARKLNSSIPGTLPIGDISRKRLEEAIREYYIDPAGKQEEKKSEVAPVQPEETEEDPEEPEGTQEDSETPEETQDEPEQSEALPENDDETGISEEGDHETIMPMGGDDV